MTSSSVQIKDLAAEFGVTIRDLFVAIDRLEIVPVGTALSATDADRLRTAMYHPEPGSGVWLGPDVLHLSKVEVSQAEYLHTSWARGGVVRMLLAH